MKRKMVGLLLISIFSLGMVSGVMAITTIEKIQANLNYGITVKYNGEIKTFKDVNGKRVYPISYKGTTYLPLRGVAELFNTSVEWDNETQTIGIGNEIVKRITKDMFSTIDGLRYSTDKEKLVVADKQYDSGLLYEKESTSAAPSFTLKLPKRHENLSFTILCDTQRTFKVYNPKGVVIKSFTCEAGKIFNIEIPVKGLEYIQMLSKNEWNNEQKGDIIIVDMLLK